MMENWLFQLLSPLEDARIPYAVVGSVASSVYGEPRATNDVDVLIQLSPDDAARLSQAFPAGEFYVPPPEIIAIELGRSSGGHINIIALETMAKADVYPLSPGETDWFARRRRLVIEGRDVWFAIPEAVILHKLRFYREGGSDKHLRDIRGMLAVSGDEIDRAILESRIAELGLDDFWRRVSGA